MTELIISEYSADPLMWDKMKDKCEKITFEKLVSFIYDQLDKTIYKNSYLLYASLEYKYDCRDIKYTALESLVRKLKDSYIQRKSIYEKDSSWKYSWKVDDFKYIECFRSIFDKMIE